MNQINQTCLISGEAVTPILDLGMHSYADTFVSENQLHLSEPVLPLVTCMNTDTGMIQLKYLSDDWDRYNLYSYSYTSSNSEYSRNHWDSLAQILNQRGLLDQRVVEVGCNDGYLLKQLGPRSLTLGVDTSGDMCELAREQGLRVDHAVFNWSHAAQIRDRHGSAGLVVANNVLNHANDPVNFVRAVDHLLDDQGWFVFEVPDWSWMIQHHRWDMIYHEHVSYFTVQSLYHLLKSAGLKIQEIHKIQYHGQSIRIFAQKSTQTSMTHQVQSLIDQERQSGLFEAETYQKFQTQINSQRNATLQTLLTMRQQCPERPIIGVGAAAKANTFLNFHNINTQILSYITDSSPQKQGKYTPLSRIPIVSDEIFTQWPQPYALILSWNISDVLKNILLRINPHIEFISL